MTNSKIKSQQGDYSPSFYKWSYSGEISPESHREELNVFFNGSTKKIQVLRAKKEKINGKLVTSRKVYLPITSNDLAKLLNEMPQNIGDILNKR